MKRYKQAILFAVTAGVLFYASQASFAQEAIAEAVAEAEPIAEAVGEDASLRAKVRPLTVAAGLVDDSVITGTLIDSTSISIRTAFGAASIPLSEVAGIRFPNGEDASTTVVMLNGDSITGATDLKFASVETTWGSAKINGQNIATMLFVPGLRWESTEGLGGKRWTLVEASSPMQPARDAVQSASGTRPSQPPALPNNGQPIPNRTYPFR
ncbi:MAG: hypothetical protein ACE361_06740 [Aureliella sp.]